ncbi:MAG: UrcA family protein [Pseudomonadota bacterium]
MTTFKTFAAAFALTAAIAAPATSAQAAPEGKSVLVPIADLNLNSQSGREVLDRRIAKAVNTVCGQATGPLAYRTAAKKCQAKTMAVAKQSRDLAVAEYETKRFAKASERVIRLVAQ